MGSGWSWSRKAGTDDDHAAAAAEGWQEIKRRLAEEQHTLYVLDEFTYPINWGWVDLDDVIDTLTTRSRLPARDHHRSAGRPETDRGSPAGHRDDQDQTSLRRRTEGSARNRVVIDPESPDPSTELPRLVIAAPGSGHGKTTVATGLMGALSCDGSEGRRLQGRAGLHRPWLPHAGHRSARDATSIPISAASSR